MALFHGKGIVLQVEHSIVEKTRFHSKGRCFIERALLNRSGTVPSKKPLFHTKGILSWKRHCFNEGHCGIGRALFHRNVHCFIEMCIFFYRLAIVLNRRHGFIEKSSVSLEKCIFAKIRHCTIEKGNVA